MKTGSVRLHLISEAVTPISHMSGVSGNESIINREKVLYKNKIVNVPVLSGNAIRHKMIREPGARYLLDQLNLNGSLTKDQANYFFVGGSLTESSISENLKQIADMQNYFPLLRVLGGSLRNQILSGSLYVSRGMLLCEENMERIMKAIPEKYRIDKANLKNSENYISKYQYTRGDSTKMKDASQLLLKEEIEKEKEGKSNLMLYAGQTIIPGSIFYHDFFLHHVGELELGAILHSLEYWANNDSTIGGTLRIGHGRLKTRIIPEYVSGIFVNNDDKELHNYTNMYIEHVQTNKENCLNWIKDTFPSKDDEKKKKPGKKAVKTAGAKEPELFGEEDGLEKS